VAVISAYLNCWSSLTAKQAFTILYCHLFEISLFSFTFLKEMLLVGLVEFWPFMANYTQIVNSSTPETMKQADGIYDTY